MPGPFGATPFGGDDENPQPGIVYTTIGYATADGLDTRRATLGTATADGLAPLAVGVYAGVEVTIGSATADGLDARPELIVRVTIGSATADAPFAYGYISKLGGGAQIYENVRFRTSLGWTVGYAQWDASKFDGGKQIYENVVAP